MSISSLVFTAGATHVPACTNILLPPSPPLTSRCGLTQCRKIVDNTTLHSVSSLLCSYHHHCHCHCVCVNRDTIFPIIKQRRGVWHAAPLGGCVCLPSLLIMLSSQHGGRGAGPVMPCLSRCLLTSTPTSHYSFTLLSLNLIPGLRASFTIIAGTLRL